jgi:hypothetical protein
MRQLRFAVLLLVAAAGGCLRSTTFQCETTEQCGGGNTCEPEGYCSRPDPSCTTSGSRFHESAGPYANKCVGTVIGDDAGVDDAPEDDAPPTVGCPNGYATLPNAGPNMYKLLTAADTWDQHRDACRATDPTRAYLAIPDNLAEMQAMSAAATAATFWVGIHDQTTEGTYVTVKNATPTFLDWAPTQPDNAGGGDGEDCVAGLSGTAKLQDDRCNKQYRALCECEP